MLAAWWGVHWPEDPRRRITALTNLLPYRHLKDAPLDVAYAALAHLLERNVKEPSRRPPKRPAKGQGGSP